MADDEEVYVVEAIRDCRGKTSNGWAEYLVKWKGWVDPTWEPEAHVAGTSSLTKWLESKAATGKKVPASKKAPKKPAGRPPQGKVWNDAEGKYVADPNYAPSAKPATKQKSKKATAAAVADDEEEFVVEKIQDSRTRSKGRTEYLVKWKGWPKPTWEPAEHVAGTAALTKWQETDAAIGKLVSTAKKAPKKASGRPPSANPAKTKEKATKPKKEKVAKPVVAAKKAEDDEEEFVVEKIQDSRTRSKGRTEYRVKWKGWPKPTWEPAEHVAGTAALTQWQKSEAATGKQVSKTKKAPKKPAGRPPKGKKWSDAEGKYVADPNYAPSAKPAKKQKSKKATAAAVADDEEEYVVEKIQNSRDATAAGRTEYLVKWKGWAKPTWEPEEHVAGTAALTQWQETEAATGKQVPASKKAPKKPAGRPPRGKMWSDAEGKYIADPNYAPSAKPAKKRKSDTAPAAAVADDEEEFVVEKIQESRAGSKGRTEYLVKWKGWAKPTWEPEDHVAGTAALTQFAKPAKRKSDQVPTAGMAKRRRVPEGEALKSPEGEALKTTEGEAVKSTDGEAVKSTEGEAVKSTEGEPVKSTEVTSVDSEKSPERPAVVDPNDTELANPALPKSGEALTVDAAVSTATALPTAIVAAADGLTEESEKMDESGEGFADDDISTLGVTL